MRLLVVGGSGMLGSDLIVEAQDRGIEVVAPSSTELDITDPESIAHIPFRTFGRFDYCVNCAGYTAVDKAETDLKAATELNAIAPGYLANACSVAGINLIHISTDYVFDGARESPYTEDDPTNPLCVYGETKLAGELAVQEADATSVILRTSWLYGPNGQSFPRTMIRAWEAGKDLRVVADQSGTPTYTRDLAHAICEAMERKLYPGIYHAASSRVTNWYQFADAVLKEWLQATNWAWSRADQGRLVNVQPIGTADWPTPAKRPPNSALSSKKLNQAGVQLGDRGIQEFVERLLKDWTFM